MIAIGKAADVAQGRDHGLRHRVIDAGQSHQQFDAWIGIGLGNQHLFDMRNLRFHGCQEAQIAVEQLPAFGVDSESVQPGKSRLGKQVGAGIG